MENGQPHSPEGGFTYSYSAPTEEERREIVAIRSQYAARSERELAFERLKLLDRRVRRVPAVLFGIQVAAGVLMFGGGLALCLEGVAVAAFIAGTVLCVLGGALFGLSWLTKKAARAKLSAKYGGEILKLSARLLGEKGEDDGAR